MTKEELKEHIKQLKLESDLEGMVFELIDKAKEVNAELLDGIADILDLQADFYEKAADVLEEEARAYDKLDAEFNNRSQTIKGMKIEELGLLQEEFTNEISKKLQGMKMDEEETPDSSSDTSAPSASV